MITTSVYAQNFLKTRKTLSKRIRDYVNDQSADNVHDLRTASRRLLACFQLLPKEIRRNKKTAKYSRKLEKVLRVNAPVRDLDIILSRISERDDSGAYRELSKQAAESRASELKRAVCFVSSVKKTSRPLIHEEDLSDTRLQKRFDKINRKLESKLRERLPIVLGDPADQRALHQLREDSRRLRYVLELAGASNASEPISLLRSWQEILGLVHDSDIVVDYLQHLKQSPEVQDMLHDEITTRHLNYEKFASMATTRLVLKLSK